MDDLHLALCASPAWRECVERDLVPWVVGGRELGDDVVEVSRGPGLTTDVLRRHVPRLTAIEIDPALPAELVERLVGTNVTVVCRDAADTGLPS